jgi:glycosyltransferase involved in cell wall biosynthesis
MAGKKIRLSVILATYNEQDNIRRCLKAVRCWVDEIIVVDGSSDDKTRDLARTFGAKVFKTTNKPIFHINKQMALDKARGEWILQLDADEVVTNQLQKEITQALNSKMSGFWIPRKNYFLGKWLKKGGQYPDYVIRLVKKGKARFPCKSVHEQIEIDGEVGYLKNPLDHFTTPTIERYWTNANRYTSLTAKELVGKKQKTSFFSHINFIFVKPVKTFFSLYLRHKGFMDGYPGFLFALFSALHHPIAYFKYWEIRNKNWSKSIKKILDKKNTKSKMI